MTLSQTGTAEIKADNIGSLLGDISVVISELYKDAARLDSHADNLLGSIPAAAGTNDEKVGAATVIQKLRDAKRELRNLHERLADTANRLDNQF